MRPLCSAIAAGGLRAAQGPQNPEGSRCSEMHSQPYMSPKGVIPDENSSCFEKTIYLFHTFLVYRPVCLWHNAIAARGLGAAQGPQKPEGSRYSEMHSQPYLRPFFYVQVRLAGAQLFFFMESELNYFFLNSGHDYFFQLYIQGTIIFFNYIHPPPPPPP